MYIEGIEVTKRAFSSLSFQGRNNSQSCGYKGKKPWNNKENKSSVKPNKRSNAIVKSNGNKEGCKTCGNLHFGECWFKGEPKCHKYDKFGHIAKDCMSNMVQQFHYAKDVGEKSFMFFACNSTSVIKDEHVWFIDSGCSNHMTYHESLLRNVVVNVITRIKMGNEKIVQAIAKGTLVIKTKNGSRYIKEVMLVPRLAENSLMWDKWCSMAISYYLEMMDVAIFDNRKLENHVVTMQIND